MKKILTSAMMLALAMTATAGEYQVYNNGTLAAGLSVETWDNAVYALDATDPAGGTDKTYSFNPGTKNTSAASMGFLSHDEAVCGPLHSATLSFKWYAEGTGKYTIRLTSGIEENYSFEVTADNAGKWNSESLVIADKYPQVAEKWNAGGAGYVFSVVCENGENAKIYFQDIKYTGTDDVWVAPEVAKPATVPVPETPAADVMSLFSSKYDAAIQFSIGSWGQSTQATLETIDGAPVYALKNFNYLGWAFNDEATININEMQYMHVDYWTPNGTTFGFTPISKDPTQEKGWKATTVNKEEWNSYDVPLSYFDNVDLSKIFQVKFDQGSGNTGYIANVYFYKKDDVDPDPEPDPEPDPSGVITYEDAMGGTVSQTNEGVTTDYSYVIRFKIVYNADKTLTITPVFEWADGKSPAGLEPWTNVYVNNVEKKIQSNETSVTTTETFNTGDRVEIRFYKPFANGVVEAPFNFVIGTATGVDNIGAEAGEAVYYDLRGVRVANPEHGIFIRVQGNKATKIAL